MEQKYYSKGVNQTKLLGTIVSIIVGFVLGIMLLVLAGSTVKGEPQLIKIGGINAEATFYTPEYDRYDSETQDMMCTCAAVLIIVSVAEVALLALQMRSWTEIYEDSVRGNYMGKSIACRISDVTGVSVNKLNQQVVLTGPAGRISLIVKDPDEVQEIIQDLMYNKIS